MTRVKQLGELTKWYLQHEDGEAWFDGTQLPAFILKEHSQLVEFCLVIAAEIIETLSTNGLLQALRLGTRELLANLHQPTSQYNTAVT